LSCSHIICQKYRTIKMHAQVTIMLSHVHTHTQGFRHTHTHARTHTHTHTDTHTHTYTQKKLWIIHKCLLWSLNPSEPTREWPLLHTEWKERARESERE